jgi:hypothetical protein
MGNIYLRLPASRYNSVGSERYLLRIAFLMQLKLSLIGRSVKDVQSAQLADVVMHAAPFRVL